MSRLSALLLVVLLALFAGLLGDSVNAQGGAMTCPDLVLRALEAVNTSCEGLSRNDACYGYASVQATFFEGAGDYAFAAPADRVPLPALQTIRTSALDAAADEWGMAVLNLQADLPDTLPGQVLTFLLMGDVSLQNAVAPGEAAMPVEPVAAATRLEAALFRTTGAADTLGTLPAGTRLQLIGQDAGGTWYQVELNGGDTAWIAADAVSGDAAALAALPIEGQEGGPRFGPMQAFYLDVGLATPTCNEAPNALVINTGPGQEMTFQINEAEVSLGSLAVFTIVRYGGQRVLVGVLVDGDFLETTINGQVVRLTEPGRAFGIALNDEGLIDGASNFVPVPLSLVRPYILSACDNAALSGIFEGLSAQVCDIAVLFFNTPASPANPPAPPLIPVSQPVPASTTPPPGGPVVTTQVFPVYFCQHLGGNNFQWFEVEVTYENGVSVAEQVLGGPFMGEWRPGCPAGEPDVAVCGDGRVELPEQCDPPDGETCSLTCRTSTPAPTPEPVCGNGTVERGEQCDPPDGETCDSACQEIAPVCGNGVVEQSEQCDPPDGVYCDAACQDIVFVCGDGVVNPGEQCDPPDGVYCDAACQDIVYVCGDGVVNPGEQCDPPDGVYCDATCQDIIFVCGNGIVEPGEQCDPPDGVYCDAACQDILF